MKTNHAEFISKMLCTCWNIDKLRGRTLLSAMIHTLVHGQRPEEDIWGDPLPKMQIVGDIALIPVTGILSIDCPDWLKQIGINLTDANDIEEEVEEALDDANVQLIVQDGDSLGGLSLAGDKLFDVFEAANKKKPVMTYCADGHSLASSMYESAAPSRAIYCGPFADSIGCVGTYLAHLDDTEYWAKIGMKWEIFKSGDVKAIGESVPLTQQQRDFLQETVDRFGNNFRRNVKKYRTSIDPADLQGQFYEGTTAAKKNFVTGLAPDLQSAISKFRRTL